MAWGTSGAPGGAAAGFTLIGLMVLIAVVNIGLAVALTSWATIGKRAKEAELIWRGQQYARALQCYRGQNGGLPDKLDELLESDCIRALYPDPMTPGGQWHLIRESELDSGGFGGSRNAREANRRLEAIDLAMRGPEAFFGGGGGRFPSGAAGGRFPTGAAAGGRAADRLRNATDRTSGDAESLQTAYERLRNLTVRLRQDFAGSGDGIAGVVSTSTAAALRTYEGESTYDAWRFLAR